jgi:hypothetical protein
VIEKSTGGNFNIAQPIFNENGDREVFFYYWTEFFNKMFKPVPNLLKYYHFIFDSECPNIIKAKKTLVVTGHFPLVDFLYVKLKFEFVLHNFF